MRQIQEDNFTPINVNKKNCVRTNGYIGPVIYDTPTSNNTSSNSPEPITSLTIVDTQLIYQDDLNTPNKSQITLKTSQDHPDFEDSIKKERYMSSLVRKIKEYKIAIDFDIIEVNLVKREQLKVMQTIKEVLFFI